MGATYRERIEKPEELVLLRVPKELQGAPLEVTLAPGVEAPSIAVDLEWDAEYRRTHAVHPSWSPEDLALLHELAGSMPEIEEVTFDPSVPDGGLDWHLLD